LGKENRVVTERAEMDEVLRGCKVCRLGVTDDGEAVYLHTGLKGRKIEILHRNPRVCLEFDILDGMIEADRGCGWSMRFRSVLVFGTAVELNDTKEKRRGLRAIMAQYSPGDYTFPDEILERTAAIRVEIDSMTGRKKGAVREPPCRT